MQDFKDDKETYLLLILSDSNLPTGSFVASAGLESTATHALLHAAPPTGSAGTDSSNILAFLRNSVDTYARSALPFARDAHRISAAYAKREMAELDVALAALARIDALYDASTLNRVARRASCAQGIALLTLYGKGFTRPPFLSTPMTGITTPDNDAKLLDEGERDRESRAGALVAALKLRVRQGESDDAPGHLPVCWGVLAGALGLDVGELEKLFDPTSSSSSRVPNPLLYSSRPWSPSTPLPSRAGRALRGGAHEYIGPLRCTAAPPTRSQASAL
jgi:urease accessory protein